MKLNGTYIESIYFQHIDPYGVCCCINSFTLPAPSDVPKFDLFKSVSEDEVRKVITKSPAKSCLLDPWPTFLVKECLDILLPSLTKLVNCSLTEGAVPGGFKKAIVSPLIKKSSLPPDELKNY